jgi:hypothetical protein
MAGRDRRGVILIVVLGVLTLLVIMATSFVTLQSIERRVTHNYTDHIRAKLAAQSGLESAIARLQGLVARGWLRGDAEERSWVYYGARTLESEPPDRSTPLDRARNPSFAIENEHPQNPGDAAAEPRRLTIDGTETGLSGTIGGTYTPNGDIFLLRVQDAQSMININDGVTWGPNHSVSRNLRRLLNALGEQPSLAAWKRNPGDRLGDLLLSNRPPGGYQSKRELLKLLDNDPARLAALAGHITTHSWRNPWVAEPVPLSAAALPAYPAEVVYSRPQSGGSPVHRFGPGINRSGAPLAAPLAFYDSTAPDSISAPPMYCALFSFDALNPQWIEKVERAPVNVNTASIEVLTALLTDLEGFFLSARRRATPEDIFYEWLPHVQRYEPSIVAAETPGTSTNGEIGFLYRTYPLVGPGSRWGSGATQGISAPALAQEIAACRDRKVSTFTGIDYSTAAHGGPFRTWAQFNCFVDSLVGENGLIWDPRPIYFDYTGTDVTPSPYIPGVGIFKSVAPIAVASVDPGIEVAGAGTIQLTASGGDGRIVVTSTAPITATNASPEGGSFVVISSTTSGGVYRVEAELVRGFKPKRTVIQYGMNPSYAQRWHASMAAADAIKANANPNLHLNELNPDRILHTRVDKTDLLVHSTELCFVPMGIFEIESLGLVLDNDAPPGSTILDGSLGPIESCDNRVVARKLMHAVVQLYDAEHHTTQAQFYEGTFAERHSSPNLTTNNNRSVETGPEPDNGPAPMECSWDGYVALPSRLGPFQDQPVSFSKPKGQLWTSYQPGDAYPGLVRAPAGSCEFGERIHAHFGLNHAPEFHIDGASETKPVGPYPVAGEASMNFPKRGETRAGPYGPADSVHSGDGSPQRYRLCRAFTMPPCDPATGALGAPPAGFAYAPSDLRVDGALTDLHSIPGFRVGSQRILNNAVISFWYKPAYFPEQISHTRTLFSMMRYSQPNIFSGMPFSVYLLPAWHSDEASMPLYSGISHRLSLLWCVGFNSEFARGGSGTQSQTLNHEFEPQISQPENNSRFWGKLDNKFNELRGHEWVHVTVVCEPGEGYNPNPPPPTLPPRMRIYVNGRLSSIDPDIRVHTQDSPTEYAFWQGLSIRLGGELSEGGLQQARNYYARGTMDEMFYWCNHSAIDGPIDAARGLYAMGRYYKPDDNNPADALFTSLPLALRLPDRKVASASTICDFPGTTPMTALSEPAPKKRVLALSWTALAEDFVATGGRLQPVMWDYSPRLGSSTAAPAALSPSETVCALSVQAGTDLHGPYHDEGWSAVGAEVGEGESCVYKAKLRVGAVTPNSILLATPVLDDVTVFYWAGPARYLSCVEAR